MTKELLTHKQQIIKQVRQYFNDAKCKTAIIGISGGIDSAVGLNILIEALGADNVVPFFVDIESSKQDYLDAQRVCKAANVLLNYIDLTKLYRTTKKTFKQFKQLSLSNLKSRLRMIYLYDQASNYNGLVCGNSNLDELYIGYFTKYGDNACDIATLCSFIKEEIKDLAIHYNVPETIIYKAPTAGLYEGQTDEKEIGVSYKEIDAFLLGKQTSEQSKKIINNLHNKNKHKLNYNYIVNKDSKRLSCLKRK